MALTVTSLVNLLCMLRVRLEILNKIQQDIDLPPGYEDELQALYDAVATLINSLEPE